MPAVLEFDLELRSFSRSQGVLQFAVASPTEPLPRACFTLKVNPVLVGSAGMGSYLQLRVFSVPRWEWALDNRCFCVESSCSFQQALMLLHAQHPSEPHELRHIVCPVKTEPSRSAACTRTSSHNHHQQPLCYQLPGLSALIPGQLQRSASAEWKPQSLQNKTDYREQK